MPPVGDAVTAALSHEPGFEGPFSGGGCPSCRGADRARAHAVATRPLPLIPVPLGACLVAAGLAGTAKLAVFCWWQPREKQLQSPVPAMHASFRRSEGAELRALGPRDPTHLSGSRPLA